MSIENSFGKGTPSPSKKTDTIETREIQLYNQKLDLFRKQIAKEEQETNFTVAVSKIQGQGLLASKEFMPGELVSKYPIGQHEDLKTEEQIEPGSDFDQSSIQYGVNEKGEALYIAVPIDNPRRFLNHSCDPNCMLSIGRKEKDLIYSDLVPIRPIKSDEELTIDYSTTQLTDWEIPCNCGAANCRHKVTDFKHLPADKQQYYLSLPGAVPEWMKKELEKIVKPNNKENQPALATVDRLVSLSKFKRSTTETPNCKLEINEKIYTIEAIEYGEHPDIEKIQKLLVDTFGEDEVDPEEVLRAAIEGKTTSGEEDVTRYRIYAIKNEAGEVLSMIAGGLLDLEKNGIPTGETMFMIGYAVTIDDDSKRKKGLAREAYISSIIGAAQEAEAQGKKLSFAAGECTYTSEKFWNSIDWKRAYGKDKSNPNTIHELQYVQPALDFNKKTGQVADGAGEVPEHLMIDSFGSTPATKEQIMQTVEAFYRWCNEWSREDFKSEKAYQKHFNYVRGIKEKFREQLESLGELTFMSNEEREQAKKSGMQIKEHEEADHSDTGDEDF